MVECGKLRWQYGAFGLHPEVRLVDIYRQMGEWEKANTQIASLRNREYFEHPSEMFEYLALEEKLIKRHDSTIQ